MKSTENLNKYDSFEDDRQLGVYLEKVSHMTPEEYEKFRKENVKKCEEIRRKYHLGEFKEQGRQA